MTSTDRQRLLEQLAHVRAQGSDDVHVLAEGPAPDAATVVLVHPVGGGLLCYRDLARALGSDMRVLGLAARHEVLESHAGHPLSDLAGAYVEKLRSVDDAVSVVCGWSHGGLVAWEIAQVMSGDESGPAVVLVDTMWPQNPCEPLPAAEVIAEWFVEDLARTNQLDPVEIDNVALLSERLRLDRALVAELQEIFVLNSQAFLRHSPTPGRSPLTLVAAPDTDTRRLDEMALAHTEVVRVSDVDHYSLLVAAHGVSAVADAVLSASRRLA